MGYGARREGVLRIREQLRAPVGEQVEDAEGEIQTAGTLGIREWNRLEDAVVQAVHGMAGFAREMEQAEVAQLGTALGLDALRDLAGETEQHVARLFDRLDDDQLLGGRRAVQDLRESRRQHAVLTAV